MSPEAVGLALVGDELTAPGLDERARMVLDVLAGRDTIEVAAEHATAPRVLERWVAQFVAGGGRALEAQDLPDDSTADHLLAIVAHEIRSPLTSAAMALRLLASDKLDDARRQEIGERVADQLNLLAKLANDVLDGASVALGRSGLNLETLNLQDLVASYAADLGERLLHVAGGPPRMVVADQGRVRQIVSNVVRNALRHGTGDVYVELSRHRGCVEVSVTNHAREPVSDADASQWFEPFATVSSRTGHGLGLYVVRALTAAHTGTAGVDSLSCDRCTTRQDLRVWIRLPIAGPPQTDRQRTHAMIPSQTDHRAK